MAGSLKKTLTVEWMCTRAQVVAIIRPMHSGCQVEIQTGIERTLRLMKSPQTHIATEAVERRPKDICNQ